MYPERPETYIKRRIIMGQVIILPETVVNPITVIGRNAAICYDSDITDDEKNYKRGIDCITSFV